MPFANFPIRTFCFTNFNFMYSTVYMYKNSSMISERTKMWDWDEHKLEYIGGGSSSHSGTNIANVQDLIEKYSGKRIPTIEEDFINSEDEDLHLIEPKEMSQICKKILADDEVDKVNMRHRIELFKNLSDEGYFLSYDYM